MHKRSLSRYAVSIMKTQILLPTPSAHHHLWWRSSLHRAGRASFAQIPVRKARAPAGLFASGAQKPRDGGQDTTKTSTEVPTCSEGSTSAQGPAAGDGTRKTSDSNPSADNHHPTGTRHDNASIPRLRRRPPSSARALRGRHGQALHLRGRLRPHGPRSRRRPHALLGSLLAKSPSEYWKAAVRGASSELTGTVVLILIASGIFSAMMKASGVADGLVFLGGMLHLTGHAFTVFVLLASSLMAAATGSSIGTLSPPCRSSSLRASHSVRIPPCSRAPSSRAPSSATTSRPSPTSPSSRRSPSAFATARPPTSQASCAPGFPTR